MTNCGNLGLYNTFTVFGPWTLGHIEQQSKKLFLETQSQCSSVLSREDWGSVCVCVLVLLWVSIWWGSIINMKTGEEVWVGASVVGLIILFLKLNVANAWMGKSRCFGVVGKVRELNSSGGLAWARHSPGEALWGGVEKALESYPGLGHMAIIGQARIQLGTSSLPSPARQYTNGPTVIRLN